MPSTPTRQEIGSPVDAVMNLIGTQDDKFRVPVGGFDGMDRRVQFIGHALRVIKITLNEADYDLVNCTSVRQSLLRRLSDDICVMQAADQCVLTFPLRTLDDRHPDVFVDKKLGGSYLVHDAGKTASHLFAQGIHMTESRNSTFRQIASHLGRRVRRRHVPDDLKHHDTGSSHSCHCRVHCLRHDGNRQP